MAGGGDGRVLLFDRSKATPNEEGLAVSEAVAWLKWGGGTGWGGFAGWRPVFEISGWVVKVSLVTGSPCLSNPRSGSFFGRSRALEGSVGRPQR